MRHHSIGLPAFLLALVSLGAASIHPVSTLFAQQAETVNVAGSAARGWSSADGKFTFTGKLTAIEGEKIRLEAADGKKIVAPLDRLSAADQAFVKEEAARAASAANPFMEEGAAGAASSPFVETENAPAATLDLNPDMFPAQPVELASDRNLDPNAPHWKPAPGEPVKKFRVRGGGFHTRAMDCCSGAGGKLFAMSFYDPFGIELQGAGASTSTAASRTGPEFPTPCKSWIELVELPGGRSLGQFRTDAEQAHVGDIDPSGRWLVTFDSTFVNEPKIRIYGIQPGSLQLRTSWLSKTGDGQNQKASAARFLADGKLAVQHDRQLVVWKTDPVEPVFSVDFDGTECRLAGDLRHALVQKDGRRYEVDLVGGTCTAAASDESASSLAGSPSPDGQRLARFRERTFTLTDADGETLDEFHAPVFWPTPKVSWLDDATVEIVSPNQTHYVDPALRVVLAEVNSSGGNDVSNGWRWEQQRSGQNSFFVVSQITRSEPQLPDLAAMRKRLPKDADSLLLFRNGDRVRLTLEMEADPARSGDAEKSIRALLEERGVVVDSGAKDELRAFSKARQETVEYRRFGAPPWDPNAVESVSVRIVESKIELLRDGKPVWSNSTANGPGFMLHMQEGESAQQAADRQTGDPARFWESLRLPRHVATHPNGGAWFRLLKNDSGYQILE